MSKKKILSGFPVIYSEDEITLNLLVWRKGWDTKKQEPGTERTRSWMLVRSNWIALCAPSEYTSTA